MNDREYQELKETLNELLSRTRRIETRLCTLMEFEGLIPQTEGTHKGGCHKAPEDLQ